MAAHVCYHCKQLVEKDEPHDCWTTTEAALTRELSEDLRDAWERLRDTAAEFGEQRIYASHHCIMFSRKACYFFVRPKRSALEVVFFLGRMLKAPQVRRTEATSRTKTAHIVHVTHRDEVEPPMTDWLREAYDTSDALSARPAKTAATVRAAPATTRAHKKRASPKRADKKRADKKRASRTGASKRPARARSRG